MDEDGDNIINFESILKNKNLKKQLRIYSERTEEVSPRFCSKENYTTKHVLLNITNQLNALQRADSVKTENKNRLRLLNVKNPAFEPVNLLELDNNKPLPSYQKFETQGVSDTQLINIVVNTENLVTPKGATQEFEHSFNETHIRKENKDVPPQSPVIYSKKESHLMVNDAPKSIRLATFQENVPGASETCIDNEQESPIGCRNNNIGSNNQNSTENNITLNPIINNNKHLEVFKNSSPLIYALDAFENFETLAFPIVELNSDVDAAKAIISSQIMDREFCLTTRANITISRNERSLSPILSNRILGTSASKSANDYDKIDKKPLKEPDKVTSRKEKIVNKTGTTKCFEEDIFCSDEENSEEEDFRELLKTCVLQTSLSIPTDNLDQTMYVGFQTANNKSIQIQTDSFTKARSILENLDGCKSNPTLTELVEMFDNTSKNIEDQVNIAQDSAIEKSVSIDVTSLENKPNSSYTTKKHNLPRQHKTFEDEHDHSKPLKCFTKEIGLVGFKTASSKKINLSEKAFARSRQVFQDIDINEVFDPKEPTNTFCSAKNIGHDQNLDKVNKFENFISPLSQLNKGKDEMKELLEISEQTALNDQIILQEFENELISPHITTDLGKRQIENESEDAIENLKRDKAFSKHEDHLKDEYAPKKTFCAGGYSETNWNDELLGTQPKSVNVSKRLFGGFKTANNKEIKISEHALAKTKNIFDDLNMSNNFNEIFEKGSGYEMNNHEGIKKDQKQSLTYHNIEANNPQNQNINDETSTSKISFKNNSDGFDPLTACGFITASKKPIVISSEAIVKSKKIFEDIDSSMNGVIEQLEKKGNKVNQELEISDNSQLRVCGKAFSELKQVLGNSNDDSKKSDHLKLEAYQTTKYPIIDRTKVNNSNNDENKFKSFKKPASIRIQKSDNVYLKDKLFKDLLFEKTSEQSKEKVNLVLGSNHETKGINNLNQVFKGFQTASNKQVKISEKSLAASKKLFQDLKLNENNQKPISSSTSIDVHEYESEAKFDHVQSENIRLNDFAKDKPHFEDQDFAQSKIKPQLQAFNGFRSANNKIIKISEQALAKSKNLFSDLDINNDLDELKKKAYNVSYAEIDNDYLQNKLIKEKLRDLDEANNKNCQYSPNEECEDFLPNNKRMKLTKDSDEVIKQVSSSNHSLREQLTSTFCNTSSNRNKTGELLFKTANNNEVKVSEAALFKTKTMLMDLNQNNQICSFSQNTDEKIKGNFQENIINTQLLNNFEDTLYTEDFCKDTTPVNSKRCGSPILSCPRPKKRRNFEVPYNKWEVPKIKVPEGSSLDVNNSNVFAFDKNYKKNTKMSLKTIRDIEKLNKYVTEVDPYISTFNFDNILDFEFAKNRNEIGQITWNVEDLKKYFISLVNSKIIPDGWLDNHLRMIMSKLISYEMEYKYAMQGICSVKNVLEQLKYRYDRELFNVERPALRKLLEKDDVSTKTMVLRVIAMYVDGVSVDSVTETSNLELLLTDGWYCIKASVDQMLTRLVRERKIKVGSKLVTNGAELLNCEQGIAPWEDTSSVRLKLFGNSTRRALWDAKLGYHSGAAILSRLSRIELEGGKVSKLRAVVTRVYPTLYVEKFEDGSTVTRSERLEHLYQMKYESDRQALLEKIYEEVEKQFVDEESQDSEYEADVDSLETGTQINRLMKRSRDSGEFITNLTSSQLNKLQNYADRRRERLVHTLQARVKDKIKEQGLQVARNVVPVLKIRIADVSDDGEVSKTMLSIWRPNEAVMDIIKEGTWIEAFNVVPTARRYSETQLSAGRQTVFSRSNYKRNEKVQHIAVSLKRTCYSIESLVKNPATDTDYNEVDVVGLIFLIEPSIVQFESTKGQHFQNVYLTDADKNIICVNFWGGLKKFGYENILDTRLVVACMNLQKRTGNSRKGIPQYRATEYSYFTKTPKHTNVRMMMEDLNNRLTTVNIKQLSERCVAIKNNYSIVKNNVENVSPYRINYSDYNISKHKAFIESPMSRKPNHVDDILNLSGLDFESTFKQIDTQDVPADVLIRKKKVNEKIAKLKMYGEPPPLKAIHIMNKSKNATKDYKSPLAWRHESCLASEKLHEKSKSAQDCGDSTPEPSNGNRIKRINANPVKLNFSSNILNDGGENKVDPFAEEFDVSPPLSLD